MGNNSRLLFIIFSAFLFLYLFPSNLYAATTPVSIMFLGDSITEGGIGLETPYGYVCFRTEVENRLRAANISYDFVGTYPPSGANPLNPLPNGQPGPMFDQDNNGYPGKGGDFFLANIGTVVPPGTKANYVVFLLGANDMYFDVNSTITIYEAIWDALRSRLPGVHIIVSGNTPNLVVPSFPPAINALLQQRVAARVGKGQAFSYVDPKVLTTEMADNLHPNSAGHLRMGTAYSNVLISLINGTPTPSTKPGDANNDSKVDGLDYVIWLTNYSTNQSGSSKGDFNNDSKVDGLDYVIWLSNYGK